MTEGAFKSYLLKQLRLRFPNCIILKNDPSFIQGFPDLTILYKDRWAVLELKRDGKAKVRPNQEYYVKKLNEMSFAAFIHPENWKGVLDEMERSFQRHT